MHWIRKYKELPILFEGEPNTTFRYKNIIETKISINNSKSRCGTAEKIANAKKYARML